MLKKRKMKFIIVLGLTIYTFIVYTYLNILNRLRRLR